MDYNSITWDELNANERFIKKQKELEEMRNEKESAYAICGVCSFISAGLGSGGGYLLTHGNNTGGFGLGYSAGILALGAISMRIIGYFKKRNEKKLANESKEIKESDAYKQFALKAKIQNISSELQNEGKSPEKIKELITGLFQ
jgi:hypothetical protein